MEKTGRSSRRRTKGKGGHRSPVLCIKRVKTFEEGVHLINENPYANGSVIYTQNGYYSMEFSRLIHGGMVGKK